MNNLKFLKRIYLPCFLILMLTYSCSNNNEKVNNEEWNDVNYYSNGKIKKRCKQISFTENVSLCEQYDSLGNLMRTGKYRNDLATGVHKFYNLNHNLECTRQYVIIGGKESYLNQVIRFNAAGDTIKVGSNYFSINEKKDTLTLGETYYATIKLETPVLNPSKMEIYFDVPNDTSSVRIMQAENYIVNYDYTPTHKGEYLLKGKIIEMKIDPTTTKIDTVDSRILYFRKSYYVK